MGLGKTQTEHHSDGLTVFGLALRENPDVGISSLNDVKNLLKEFDNIADQNEDIESLSWTTHDGRTFYGANVATGFLIDLGKKAKDPDAYASIADRDKRVSANPFEKFQQMLSEVKETSEKHELNLNTELIDKLVSGISLDIDKLADVNLKKEVISDILEAKREYIEENKEDLKEAFEITDENDEVVVKGMQAVDNAIDILNDKIEEVKVREHGDESKLKELFSEKEWKDTFENTDL